MDSKVVTLTQFNSMNSSGSWQELIAPESSSFAIGDSVFLVRCLYLTAKIRKESYGSLSI